MAQAGQDRDRPAAEAAAPGAAPMAFSPNMVHLIRTAQLNTVTLSQMADQKAHILIGTSFVVFSLVVTQTSDGPISWSMMCLAVTALFSTLCAVIAILPRAGPKVIVPGAYNHLFFGHFALLDEDRWSNEILAQAQNDDGLYRMMLRDLYQNGVVLRRRKYRFLAYAYQLFLGGLGLTLVLYLAEAGAVLPR